MGFVCLLLVDGVPKARTNLHLLQCGRKEPLHLDAELRNPRMFRIDTFNPFHVSAKALTFIFAQLPQASQPNTAVSTRLSLARRRDKGLCEE